VANRPAVDAHIAGVFAGLGREAAVARLHAAGTAYGFVRDIADFARHPALRRIDVATPGGPVALPVPPVSHDGETPPLGPVPAIGEHSAAIRDEFGADRAA
jgi:crotonobetainyl-CoA:carnitine CoA-transferase CaiB-like acyl-CoA transferase